MNLKEFQSWFVYCFMVPVIINCLSNSINHAIFGVPQKDLEFILTLLGTIAVFTLFKLVIDKRKKKKLKEIFSISKTSAAGVGLR